MNARFSRIFPREGGGHQDPSCGSFRVVNERRNEGTRFDDPAESPFSSGSRARHDETSNAFHEVVRRRSAFAEKDEEAEEASKTNQHPDRPLSFFSFFVLFSPFVLSLSLSLSQLLARAMHRSPTNVPFSRLHVVGRAYARAYALSLRACTNNRASKNRGVVSTHMD